MAITGLLLHTLTEKAKDVEAGVTAFEGMTCYGIHEDQYVVVVAEAPSDKIEEAVHQLEKLDGVLAVYTTYLTVEDEMDADGNLETNLSPGSMLKKKKNRST